MASTIAQPRGKAARPLDLFNLPMKRLIALSLIILPLAIPSDVRQVAKELPKQEREFKRGSGRRSGDGQMITREKYEIRRNSY